VTGPSGSADIGGKTVKFSRFQRPPNDTPVRAYPENVVLDWGPTKGPASSGVAEVHPSKQRMKAAASVIIMRVERRIRLVVEADFRETI
jgi:hypothetical protein